MFNNILVLNNKLSIILFVGIFKILEVVKKIFGVGFKFLNVFVDIIVLNLKEGYKLVIIFI